MQFLVVAAIVALARRIVEPAEHREAPRFDLVGAVLSTVGLFLVVYGILQSTTYGWFRSQVDFTVAGTVVVSAGGISPVWLFVACGVVVLAGFVLHVWSRERAGRDPLLSLRLFGSRTSNLGLVTPLVQWLVLQGSFFVVSVFIQQVRGFDAVATGLLLTPATVGILVSSAAAGRLARRWLQVTLVRTGFVLTTAGMALLLALVRQESGVWTFVPGLLLMGLGVGVMLTASVNVVQSSFGDEDQGDISGLSRSVSNLGSSLGTALAGSVLVAAARPGDGPFALALVTLGLISLLGLVAAWFIPRTPAPPGHVRSGPVPR